jgi:hypothetical protein
VPGVALSIERRHPAYISGGYWNGLRSSRYWLRRKPVVAAASQRFLSPRSMPRSMTK